MPLAFVVKFYQISLRYPAWRWIAATPKVKVLTIRCLNVYPVLTSWSPFPGPDKRDLLLYASELFTVMLDKTKTEYMYIVKAEAWTQQGWKTGHQGIQIHSTHYDLVIGAERSILYYYRGYRLWSTLLHAMMSVWCRVLAYLVPYGKRAEKKVNKSQIVTEIRRFLSLLTSIWHLLLNTAWHRIE